MLHSCFGVVGSVRVALHSSLLRLFFSVYNFFHTFVCAARCCCCCSLLLCWARLQRISLRSPASDASHPEQQQQQQRDVFKIREAFTWDDDDENWLDNDNRVDSPLFSSSSSQAQSLYSAGVFISHMPKSKSTACRYRLLVRIHR